jgi:FtsP/CotA-like multicopper oxidase with cupredoxin domain
VNELNRRLTLLAVLAWSVPLREVDREGHAHRPDGAAATPADTLSAPPILPNRSAVPGVVEVTLTAAPARLSVLPGVTTDVFAYNGRVPGPTLEVHEGDRVVIHFHNELPETTTVHWHGLHLPADQDGSPFNPIAPGERHDYVFTISAGTAGTYWYHPHPDRRAGYQVAKGLFGAIIVRAADDPLAATIPEKLLILSDNRFRSDGSIDLPDPNSPQGRVDTENGREGDVLFINGQIMPTIPIRGGAVQRWRVINASAARVYRLALPGQALLQVGSDGGLFERAVKVDEIVLANSERVELLVRGTAPPGSRLTLQTLPYDRYVPQTRPVDWNRTRDLLSLTYSPDPPLPAVALPATLRHVPVLDTAQASATRVIVLTQGMINRQVMDLNRVDIRGHLGTTEIWEIENLVGMDHPFHLHGFRFQVLDRNGVPEPYPSWKDSVNVPKHETVRFVVRFDGYGGKWMFHCHILEHEDQGMMGVLELN